MALSLKIEVGEVYLIRNAPFSGSKVGKSLVLRKSEGRSVLPRRFYGVYECDEAENDYLSFTEILSISNAIIRGEIYYNTTVSEVSVASTIFDNDTLLIRKSKGNVKTPPFVYIMDGMNAFFYDSKGVKIVRLYEKRSTSPMIHLVKTNSDWWSF